MRWLAPSPRLLRLCSKGTNQCRIQTLRQGRPGHPDPEIRGSDRSPKNFFRPFGPQFDLRWICHCKQFGSLRNDDGDGYENVAKTEVKSRCFNSIALIPFRWIRQMSAIFSGVARPYRSSEKEKQSRWLVFPSSRRSRAVTVKKCTKKRAAREELFC